MKLIQWNSSCYASSIFSHLRRIAALLAIVTCLAITGCGGCRWDSLFSRQDNKEEASEEEKKQPDFITRLPVLVPGLYPPKYDPDLEKRKAEMAPDVRQALEEQSNAALKFNRFKPGHWAEIHLPAVASNFNADGQLQTWAVTPTGRADTIPGTNYHAVTRRSVTLPKGEWKYLETLVYLPRRNEARNATVNYVLDRRTGGIPQIDMASGTPLMPSHQYHFVLLSERPDTYNFLNLTDCFSLRSKTGQIDRSGASFYVLVPSVFGEPIPLPRQALTWTTIAYLLWDDMDPAKLSREHQDALLDWLHFGGQLILSGPDCLEKLENSFLGPFLPARYQEGYNLTNEHLKDLNQHWAVPVPANRPQTKPRIFEVAGDSLRAVRFSPHRDGEFIQGTGELVIERQIGRGRIVVTAFPLNAPAVRAWPSFPSFLNSALLRRPARNFLLNQGDVDFTWQGIGSTKNDPLVGSTLRFISRDLADAGTSESAWIGRFIPDPDDDFEMWAATYDRPTTLVKPRNIDDYRFFGGFQETDQSGVASWDDQSAVANAARRTLVEAAGIIPPSSSFVLKMLAGYLIVLVPVNWLVFWLMGRVEWAWIAAPFIAIVGAIVVIKMAALDIGFVRSNTQIGLLEAWSDYPRAHVTEYSALYTSLSTRYTAQLDNASGFALPFASQSPNPDSQAPPPSAAVTLRKGVTNQLEGLQIQSNSTGLLHTEFMLDLDGAWSAAFDDQNNPTEVVNGTYLSLKYAGAIWKTDSGNYRFCWIDDLPTGEVRELRWQEISPDQLYRQWESHSLFSSSEKIASDIWEQYIGQEEKAATLEQLAAIEALAEKWPQLEPILLRINFSSEVPGLTTRLQFQTAFSSLPTDDDLQVGRVLEVLKNLKMGPSEVRMIGATDEKLGRTNFIPDSTRVNQQSVVVVHLKRPQLPMAVPDANLFTDFTGKSDLDLNRIDEELNRMGFEE